MGLARDDLCGFLKGVLLGFGIFVLGTLTCVVIAIGIAFYRLAQAAKHGASLVLWRVSVLIDQKSG